MTEPQVAADYDDRTTAAVKKVLLEIGQILGSYQGKFAVIGGAVPWLLLGAKPILDIMLGVNDRREIPKVRRSLEALGFPPCLEHALGDLDRDPRTPIRASTASAAASQAGQMAASDQATRSSQIRSCTEGGVHRWEADVTDAARVAR